MFTLLVTATLSSAAFSQPNQILGEGQPPPDFRPEEVIQRHGIALTTPSLMEALRNPDDLVRESAAMELAHRKAFEATPAMLDALNVEKTRQVQMVMAVELARMAEKRSKEAALNALQSICDDKNVPAQDRLQAAGYSLDFGEEGCLNDVVEILETPPGKDVDFQDEMQGLSLLPRFKHASEYDAQRILAAAVDLLSSSDTTVRLVAAKALAQRGDKSAIEPLQHAMTIEQNEMVRSDMSDALKALAKAR